MDEKITFLEIYKKVRKIWTRHPATKIKTSDKIYNRCKSKRELRKRLKEEV